MSKMILRTVDFFADVVEGRRLYMPLAVLYSVLLVMSNILAGAKQLLLFNILVIPGGTTLFPASYILNDAISQVYGLKLFLRVMLIGIFGLFLASTFTAVVQILPAASHWKDQPAYDAILGQFLRINFASLCAIFVGSYINAAIVEYLKYMGDSYIALAFRFILSTAIAEGFDTLIFLTIAFLGVLPNEVLVWAILGQWLFKTLWEVVALPITLPVVKALQRYEEAKD